MRLDARVLRYLTNADFTVLTAVEQSMRNHELVPVPVVAQLAKMRRPLVKQHLSTLLKHKLIAHDGTAYDGYKLTYLGYDFLVLRHFAKKNLLSGVGMRLGVGKESDIHLAQTPDGKEVALKLHRLGRVSFRSIKRNRDYMQKRLHASWMYLAKLAAIKEFSYMKALWNRGFPVPEPIAVNRHGIIMEYITSTPFCQIRELTNPFIVLEDLLGLVVRFAQHGLIHGDFNEFNLLIDDEENVTVIDFPQIVTSCHPNAEMYFDRDVNCVKNFFEKKFRVEVTAVPSFREVIEDEVQVAGLQSEFTTTAAKEDFTLLDETIRQQRLSSREGDTDNILADEDTDHQEATAISDTEIVPLQIIKVDVTADKLSVNTGTTGEDSEPDSSADGSTDSEDSRAVHVKPKPITDVWRPTVRRPQKKRIQQKMRMKHQRNVAGVVRIS
eukprot:Lankesteria_metandrocarpae@DN1808_c0_g1_i1.p1